MSDSHELNVPSSFPSVPNTLHGKELKQTIKTHHIESLQIADSGADPSLVIWNQKVIYTATYADSFVIQVLPYTNLSADLPRLHVAPFSRPWEDALKAGRYPQGMEYLRQLNEFLAADLCILNGELYAYITIGLAISRPAIVDEEIRAFRDTYRLFVMKCETSDPLGPWQILGRIITPWDLMAIDPVAVETVEGPIFFWAGHTNESRFLNTVACAMVDPMTLVQQPSILLQPLEEHEEEVNEGPTPFVIDGVLHGMFYSRGNVWKNNYRLEYADNDGHPLTGKWEKRPAPVWSGSSDESGIRGLGHGQVVLDPEYQSSPEIRYWLLYQYKRGVQSRPEHRAVAAQTFHLSADGQPEFGTLVPIESDTAPSPFRIAATLPGLKFQELTEATRAYLVSIEPATEPYLSGKS